VVVFRNFHAALALQLAEGTTAREGMTLERAPEEIVDMLRSAAGRRQLSLETGNSVGPVDWDAFDGQLAAMERTQAGGVCWWDVEYPECLRTIAEPPALLFYRGRIDVLATRGVAVVGTRKPTPAGVGLARRLGRALAAAGVPVVSGLARGIDTAAHTGSLVGPGAPVGVIGTGIDVPYPEENAGLMVDVARRGCVISEQLMGMHAERWVFPRRNRLISGLSHAVVVVQGGFRSGALITARWALEQGRDVGAVPGFPGDFRSDGPNALLKQGAFVVEDVRDVIDAVPALRFGVCASGAIGDHGNGGTDADATPDSPQGLRRRVLDVLGTAPSGPDDVAAALTRPVEEVQRALSELEIDGFVGRDEAGRYSRARG
jgi:DNA processing protein